MYKNNKSIEQTHQFIEKYNFVILISENDGGLFASHILNIIALDFFG